MTTRADIIRAARTYLGVPWKHQGRTRQGLDCGGLIALVASDCGCPLEDSRAYGRMPDGKSLQEIADSQTIWSRIPLAELAPGDVVILGEDINYPCHVGIVTEIPGQGLGLIHAHAALTNRKVVEHRLDDYTRNRIRIAYRFNGVTE